VAGRPGEGSRVYPARLGNAGNDVALILNGLAEDEVTDGVAFLRTAWTRAQTERC
jgi:hypothetical protein